MPIPRIVVKYSLTRRKWVGRCPAPGCPVTHSDRSGRLQVEQALHAHGRAHHNWKD